MTIGCLCMPVRDLPVCDFPGCDLPVLLAGLGGAVRPDLGAVMT